MQEKYDVIIIGGGPAGASAALYTARADLSTLVIDKGITAGALGKTTKIANYPGIPGEIGGPELVKLMREQAESFGAEFITDKIQGTDFSGADKILFGNHNVYTASAVIIASGAMGRKSRVEGEERLLGRGVSYCATCDAAFTRGKEIAIIGQNDEAAEEALFITRFADKVHFICPSEKLVAHDELHVELTNHPKVQFYSNTNLREVLGKDNVESIKIMDRHSHEERHVPVSNAFFYLQGSHPITDFISEPIELCDDKGIKVNQEFETSIPGIFAIGDVICNHVNQVITSAAEGATAGIAVDKYLRGKAKLQVDWKK